MKHDKIFLVILSYVIGFTTAFIAFGLTAGDLSFKNLEVVQNVQTESNLEVSTESLLTLKTNERGFFAILDGEERVISGKLNEGIEPGRGFNTSILFSSISPSGRYVYFCEQETTDQEECNEYIYVVDRHATYQLTKNSIKIAASLAGTNFSWSEVDDIADYADYISFSAEKPWKLISKN